MMLKPKHLILHWMQSQNTLINNIKGIYYFYSKWNKEKPQKKQRHFYVKMRTIYPTKWKQAWHAALRVLNMNVMVIWGHLPPPPRPFFFLFHKVFGLANTFLWFYSPNCITISGATVHWKCQTGNYTHYFAFFFLNSSGKGAIETLLFGWAINFHVYVAYFVRDIHELLQVSIGNCWPGASEG